MILPDVNVLLDALWPYAVRHELCKHWLRAQIDATAPFAVSKQILASVIRLSTNRKICLPSATLEEALGFCEDLLAQPHVIVIDPGPAHWPLFTNICRSIDAKAALITDVWIAALAIEHGCTLVTLDHDFARFPGLQWSHPA